MYNFSCLNVCGCMFEKLPGRQLFSIDISFYIYETCVWVIHSLNNLFYLILDIRIEYQNMPHECMMMGVTFKYLSLYFHQ